METYGNQHMRKARQISLSPFAAGLQSIQIWAWEQGTKTKNLEVPRIFLGLECGTISLQEVPPTISTISTIHVWQEQQAHGFNNLKENSEVS